MANEHKKDIPSGQQETQESGQDDAELSDAELESAAGGVLEGGAMPQPFEENGPPLRLLS